MWCVARVTCLVTINGMILYFKHIIHIDDFPLNGHPPSTCCSSIVSDDDHNFFDDDDDVMFG